MANAHPVLELAICTYNNAVLLERTLHTLARQTAPANAAWSVLVVDNASTDLTRALVEAVIATRRIPGLRQVREAEQGLVPARLRAVHETTAPWLAFIDDDCLLEPEWVANALAFINTHPNCGAFGGIVRPEFETPPPAWVHRYAYSYAQQEHGDAVVQREWLVGAGLVLNRVALEQSGWTTKQHLSDRKGNLLLSGGDMEMVLRIRAAGYDLWYTPHCVIRHFIPTRRTTPQYLRRINFGLGISQSWCDLLVTTQPFAPFLARALRETLKGYIYAARQAIRVPFGRRTHDDVRVALSFANGRLAGLGQVAALKGNRRAETMGCAHPPLAGVH